MLLFGGYVLKEFWNFFEKFLKARLFVRGPQPSSLRHRFGGFCLDESCELLLRGEKEIPLRPKTYSVLVYLLENPGRLVSKAELMGVVWGGKSVEEGVLNQSITEIRHALGDNRKNPKFVQTVSRKGYRFIANISDSPRGHGSSASSRKARRDSRKEERRSRA